MPWQDLVIQELDSWEAMFWFCLNQSSCEVNFMKTISNFVPPQDPSYLSLLEENSIRGSLCEEAGTFLPQTQQRHRKQAEKISPNCQFPKTTKSLLISHAWWVHEYVMMMMLLMMVMRMIFAPMWMMMREGAVTILRDIAKWHSITLYSSNMWSGKDVTVLEYLYFDHNFYMTNCLYFVALSMMYI